MNTYKVIANSDLETINHSWTQGLDYEVIERGNHIRLTSNEGELSYQNEVKDAVLVSFTKVSN